MRSMLPQTETPIYKNAIFFSKMHPLQAQFQCLSTQWFQYREYGNKLPMRISNWVFLSINSMIWVLTLSLLFCWQHHLTYHRTWHHFNTNMVIGIDTNIEVIVVSLTTWEAHHSPRARVSTADNACNSKDVDALKVQLVRHDTFYNGQNQEDTTECLLMLINIIHKGSMPDSRSTTSPMGASLSCFHLFWKNILSAMYVDWGPPHLSLVVYYRFHLLAPLLWKTWF